MRDGKPVVERDGTILMTGASGVIGRALLRARPQANTVCLVHQTPPEASATIRGDIRKRQLGLEPAEYRELANRVDRVIHCAAVTNFSEPVETINEANVEGTRNVVEFVRAARARMFHVSTAFLAFDIEAGDAHAEGAPRYVASKRVGEQVVRDSAVPATILRPSFVVGDSQTGEIGRVQAIQLATRGICLGEIPLMPLDPDTLIDFLPQDVLAGAIWHAVDNSDAEELWLTAGEHAISIGEIAQVAVDFSRRIGRPAPPTKFVDPEIVDRLIKPVLLDELPSGVRRRFEQLLKITEGHGGLGRMPSSLPQLGQADSRFRIDHSLLTASLERELERWATDNALLADGVAA